MPDTARSFSQLEAHLGYWLRRVSHSVSGEFARSLHTRQTSVAEWVLLCHLYERQQVTPGELAEAPIMPRGAISKIVNKLHVKVGSRAGPTTKITAANYSL
jgi:DNA-binding MarR family transcriptional regulator